MAINKKGMFFSLIIILLVLVVIISISFPKEYYLKDKSFVIETRINAMDRFVEDLNRDMERALYISSFRALLGMSQHIADTGNYMPDTHSNFMELMMNETLNGTIYNITAASGFYNWISKIQSEASKLGIDLNITIFDVNLSQKSAWSVIVRMDLLINILDDNGLAEWNYNHTIETVIDILEFEDPLYTVGSNGTYINTFQKSGITSFIDLTNNDTTNLTNHMQESDYIESNSSPSFLMRYSGDFNSSEFGVESLVDVNKIFSPSLRFNKTAVDYIYWSSDDPASSRIDNMPVSFRLDNPHLDIYNASGLVIPG